jgi:outer membrane protein
VTGIGRFAPKLRPQLIAAAVAALLGGASHAQGLIELYEAARAYDATYLAARAQADAAEYRAAQADALALPFVSANVKGVSAQVDLPRGRSGDNNALQGGFSGRMPLFNRANQATIEQAQRC